MKFRGIPLTSGADFSSGGTANFWRTCRASCCLLLFLSACSPSPEPPPEPTPQPKKNPDAPYASASVVSIPEEFFAPIPTPTPTPEPAKPLLPRVVFATSDFQITTHHGIQGIRAGEAVNFLRQEGEDYFVEYAGYEFKKNKSYFAATYVEPPDPSPTPVAGENIARALAVNTPAQEPPAPDEPPLSGIVPADNPALLAEQKKVGDLTASIRTLNDEIRSAQDALDAKSARSTNGATPSSSEIKKATRSIQKLKEKRDELSGQLTEMGKP